MGDPSAPRLDAAALLRTLDEEGVRFIVVGGLAATAHGATRVTYDVDVVPEWTDDNLERLASALRALGAQLHVPETDSAVAFPLDAQSLRQFEVSTWRTPSGDVDVIAGTPTAARGVLADFAELAGRGSERSAFGLTILIASLDDIIESKEALGREPDLVALPELHRLRRRHRDSDAR